MSNSFYPQDADRREWQNPEQILADIGLKPGHIFVDVGCGRGFFSLPAARIVGEKGKVLAVDINESAINTLLSQAHQEKLRHLSATVGTAEETVLCKGCADFVFFGIDLHDFENHRHVLANAKRMLKPRGRLINLDWKKEATPIGPPLGHRFSVDQARDLITALGFTILNVKDAGPYHYLMIAQK